MACRVSAATLALAYFILASCALGQTATSQPKTQDSKTSQQSLGNLARKLRPKDAHISTKRVWTTDDFASHGNETSLNESPKNTTPESAAAAIRKFQLLDQQEIGAAVLKLANAPDVNFTERKEWEQRLFEAKQAWLEQVNRLEGHKDASKDVQQEELRLTEGTQNNFWTIAEEGVEKARAVNDPIVKAHLEYKHRLDLCQSMTGDLWERCDQAAENFKRQMQRDGSW
jgi:hypothetical protein